MSNTIITNAGLNWITSASTLGPFISIKYFLPVYDYRADPNVHNQLVTSAIDTSAAMSASDTSPTGEIIYNIDTENHSYSLSETNHYVLSAGGETLDESDDPWILTNSVISIPQSINLYDGVPLSDQIYGANGVDALAITNAWEIYGGELSAGSNSVPAETSTGTDRYFTVDGYYPTSASGLLKGSFKCRLSKNIGSVKFNKIALYAIRVDENGQEIGNPALFAEAMMTNPVVKTNYGTEGFDDIVIDVQLTISTITSAWNDVFYSTSGDYWNLTPNGLYYQERVGIGDFNDGAVNIPTKLDIRSESEKQLRLTRNSSQYAELYINSAGQLTISGTDSTIQATTIIPLTTNVYNLGSATFQWGTVYLNKLKNIYDALYSETSILPVPTNNYTLGTNALAWKNIYSKALDVAGTISCQSLLPKTNDLYSLGDTTHAFHEIYVNAIWPDSTRYFTYFHGSLFPLANGTNKDLGHPNYCWDKIYGTSGIFNTLILNDKNLGSWTYKGDENVPVTAYSDNGEILFTTTEVSFSDLSLRYQYLNSITVLVECEFRFDDPNGARHFEIELPEEIKGNIVYQGLKETWLGTLRNLSTGLTQPMRVQFANVHRTHIRTCLLDRSVPSTADSMVFFSMIYSIA